LHSDRRVLLAADADEADNDGGRRGPARLSPLGSPSHCHLWCRRRHCCSSSARVAGLQQEFSRVIGKALSERRQSRRLQSDSHSCEVAKCGPQPGTA
jgi:hypothetical protein